MAILKQKYALCFLFPLFTSYTFFFPFCVHILWSAHSFATLTHNSLKAEFPSKLLNFPLKDVHVITYLLQPGTYSLYNTWMHFKNLTSLLCLILHFGTVDHHWNHCCLFDPSHQVSIPILYQPPFSFKTRAPPNVESGDCTCTFLII